MVRKLGTHGLEGEVWRLAAQSGALGVAEVALRDCGSGTSGLRKWHFGVSGMVITESSQFGATTRRTSNL